MTILLIVAVLAGCGGSDDTAATEAAPTTSSETATTPDAATDTPPRSFDELMAQLPPFDVPASPEVTAYREAALGGFFKRCVSAAGGAEKTSFVKANRALLDRVGLFPGATFVSEFTIDQRENTGCPEGGGPPTSYATDRNYKLPGGTVGQAVVRYYERRLPGWTPSFATGQCEQTFTRGVALLYVRACAQQQGSQVVPGPLRLSARALEQTSPAEPPKLPPRPTGAQYPLTTDDPTTPDPEPTEYSVEPGTTCERGQASSPEGVVPMILPPPPGVQAEIRGKEIVVEWSLGTVHGDCPPSELILSYPAVTAFTIHVSVHAASGVTRMMLLDFVPRPKLLHATAVSVDGHYSRQVAVLLRR